jgi:microcystin-dependent protein
MFPSANDVAASAGDGKVLKEIQMAKWAMAMAKGRGNHIISGCVASTSASLTFTLPTGELLINGYWVNLGGSGTVACTASNTNYIYVVLDKTANKVAGVTLTKNTTGITPTDGLLVAIATCSGSAITAVRNVRRGEGAVQIGDVKVRAINEGSDSWLVCAGQAVSRTTYADLFAEIGTTYGAGDGSTTFNVPDYRGRVPVGMDNLGGSDAGRLSWANVMGTTGGTETVTLTTAEMPAHTHTGPSHTHTGTTASSGSHTHTGTTDAQGDHTHQTFSNAGGYWRRSEAGLTSTASGTIMNTGFDGAAFNPSTGNAGVHLHNLIVGSSGSHTHTFTTDAGGTGATGSTGGGGAHNNMQPGIVQAYCIYAG